MKREKKIFTVLACLVVLSAGCVLDSDHDLIVGDGTVMTGSFPGTGAYSIVTDEGSFYSPSNLPEHFAVEGLRVHFEAKRDACYILDDPAGTWGGCIELVSIRPLVPMGEW
jgi:hypothetical protein